MIKQKDIMLIVVVVGIASMIAYAIASALIKPDAVKADVEVIESISAEFGTPDPRFFNENSLNLTEEIRIGSSNPDPFITTQDEE